MQLPGVENTMSSVDYLHLIREKIVKTDEVLKLLLEKNEMLDKLNSKYQMAIGRYLEKCNEYKKLKEECDILCMSNDEQLNKISKLEAELCLRKDEHESLNNTYKEQVNNSLLQYQAISTKLEESQNKVKEQEKRIAVLESTRNSERKVCRSCGTMMRNRKNRKSNLSDDSNDEKSAELQNQDSDSEMNEHTLFVLEAKTEITSLQNALSAIRRDNEKLQNNIKKVENDRNALRENNKSLKHSMKETEKKNVKLQERINALLLENEVMNFNHVEKAESRSVGVQTEDVNMKDDVDVDSDVANKICDEMIYLPSLISPIKDFEHDIRISKSPVIADILSLEEEEFAIRSESKELENDVLNSSFGSIRSEKLLDTGQMSTKCCSEYAASMQDDDSGESRLLGFVSLSAPVQEKCAETTVINRAKIRRKKGFMKKCSEQIYKRVLNDVLKYIHLRKRKVFLSNNRRRVMQVVKNRTTAQEKRKVTPKKEQNSVRRKQTKRVQNKSRITTPRKKNSKRKTPNKPREHSVFTYDAPPDSVDSGYSAQVSTESECSEVLSCKFSGSITELNVQSIEDCDIEKRRLELFGSDSESDGGSFEGESGSLKRKSVVESKEVVGCKRGKLNDSVKNIKEDYSRRKNITTISLIRDNQSQENQQLLNETLLSVGNNMKESNSVTDTVIIKKLPQNEGEKRVFKRPNCKKKAIETPRSPEPEQQDNVILHKPVIIPLNKPRQLRAVTMTKHFETLLTFPDEPEILEKVAKKLANQEPAWITKVIIDLISTDYHGKIETKDNPFAPLLTLKQKVLLGLMIKLENQNMSNIMFEFMVQCEKRILQEKNVEPIAPLTRFYVAVCKMKKNVHRMRKTCLDALYFMGDLVIPFLYTVLSSWSEVLPAQSEVIGSILPKVIVQVINLKTCSFPGYNLLNLRTVISRLLGYPSERWNSDELFSEIVSMIKENLNSQDATVALVILCKNHSASWVAGKLEKLTDDVMSISENLLLKQKTLDMLTQISKQFDEAADVAAIEKVEMCRKRLSDT